LIGGNRDPKVFWYSDKKNTGNPNTGHWVMALYLDGQDYALFSSANLIKWDKVCDIKNVGCSECPDMFELAVDGNKKNSRWVFWGGDGKYLIGSFNGKEFTKESGPFNTKYGGNDYAAQSYSDIPAKDGRRIQFSWLSGGEYPKMPFNQQFTVPRNLTLRTTPEGIRLFMEPAKEIETLRISKATNFSTKLQGTDKPIKVPAVNGELLDVEMVIDLKNGDSRDTTQVIMTELFGQKISYNIGKQMIDLNGIKAPLVAINQRIKLRIILDRTSVELFANDGIAQIAKCFVNKGKGSANMIVSGNIDIAVVKLKAYQLKSVWKN
jgi:sucrose-6-phosphate hydrolase SacC (GH32 family)